MLLRLKVVNGVGVSGPFSFKFGQQTVSFQVMHLVLCHDLIIASFTLDSFFVLMLSIRTNSGEKIFGDFCCCNSASYFPIVFVCSKHSEMYETIFSLQTLFS